MTRSSSKTNSSSITGYAARFGVVLGVLLAVAAGAEPASADLLVLRGGGEIETDGPWRVDGERVLFETPTGRFSSMRLDEVDLEASRARTRQAAAEASREDEPEEPAEKPKPKWVITQDDVSSVPVVREEIRPVDQVIGDPDFAVLSLSREPDATGFHLVVRGTLVNEGSERKTGIVARVRLVDPRSGGVIAESPARLDTDELPPRGATRLTARFANTPEDMGMIQVQAIQEEDEAFLGS